MKSWLAQGSSGRRVTLLPGTTFLHINGALDCGIIKSQMRDKVCLRQTCVLSNYAEPILSDKNNFFQYHNLYFWT